MLWLSLAEGGNFHMVYERKATMKNKKGRSQESNIIKRKSRREEVHGPCEEIKNEKTWEVRSGRGCT